MSTSLALFIANFIAGVHLVLIFYFLVGWLIPFTSLYRRAVLNLINGGVFLFFRFFGGCPLTNAEMYYRSVANPGVSYGESFLQRNASFLGIRITEQAVDFYSLVFNILLLCTLASILILYNYYSRNSAIKRSEK